MNAILHDLAPNTASLVFRKKEKLLKPQAVPTIFPTDYTNALVIIPNDIQASIIKSATCMFILHTLIPAKHRFNCITIGSMMNMDEEHTISLVHRNISDFISRHFAIFTYRCLSPP